MDLTQDLREFFNALVSNNVRFLVVGGNAVIAHGFVRSTEDFDFWIARDRDNARNVLRALEQLGVGSLGFTEEDFLEPGQVLMFGRLPNRIDLLTSISGVEFEDAYPRRVVGNFGGISMPLIALPDLLVNKKALGREKDLADVAEFERSTKHGS